MKRFLLCALLSGFSLFGLWFALSSTNPSASSGPGTGCSANSSGLGNGANAGGANNGGGSGVGSNNSSKSAGAVSGSPCASGAVGSATSSASYSSPAASSTQYSPSTNSAQYSPIGVTVTAYVSCHSGCQSSNSKCQAVCYQQYNITNQTRDWATCVQTCNNQLYVCSGGCATSMNPAPSLGLVSGPETSPPVSTAKSPTSFPVPGVAVSSTAPLPQGGIVSFALPQAGLSSSGGGGGGGGGGGAVAVHRLRLRS